MFEAGDNPESSSPLEPFIGQGLQQYMPWGGARFFEESFRSYPGLIGLRIDATLLRSHYVTPIWLEYLETQRLRQKSHTEHLFMWDAPKGIMAKKYPG